MRQTKLGKLLLPLFSLTNTAIRGFTGPYLGLHNLIPRSCGGEHYWFDDVTYTVSGVLVGLPIFLCLEIVCADGMNGMM